MEELTIYKHHSFFMLYSTQSGHVRIQGAAHEIAAEISWRKTCLKASQESKNAKFETSTFQVLSAWWQNLMKR